VVPLKGAPQLEYRAACAADRGDRPRGHGLPAGPPIPPAGQLPGAVAWHPQPRPADRLRAVPDAQTACRPGRVRPGGAAAWRRTKVPGGPSPPGRWCCWRFPRRWRSGPVGSGSGSRLGSGWSGRCQASGTHSVSTPRLRSPSGSRHTPRMRCTRGWGAAHG
jgi:hypothetical protein